MVEMHFDESYSSRLKLQSEGLRAEPPAAGDQPGFEGRAPDAAEILQLFSQKYAFLGIFWSKYFIF